jgi:hypothetical protein
MIPEFQLCDTFLTFLLARQEDNNLDIGGIPIVSFYDPMAVDDADRCVVICEGGKVPDYTLGNFELGVEVGLKTIWATPSLAADLEKHKLRLTSLRNILCIATADLITSLNAVAPVGFLVTYVNKGRDIKTSSNDEGSCNFYSSIELTVKCAVITS